MSALEQKEHHVQVRSLDVLTQCSDGSGHGGFLLGWQWRRGLPLTRRGAVSWRLLLLLLWRRSAGKQTSILQACSLSAEWYKTVCVRESWGPRVIVVILILYGNNLSLYNKLFLIEIIIYSDWGNKILRMFIFEELLFLFWELYFGKRNNGNCF